MARKRARKINWILTEAMALAQESGISALKIKPLAERLDCAVGAVYRYFPSKEALLAALEERAIRAVGAGLRTALRDLARAPDAQGMDAGARALAGALLAPRFYVAFQIRCPARFGLLQRLLGEPEPLLQGEAGRLAYLAALETLGLLAGELSRAATHGGLEPGDAAERALLLWASVHGVAQLRKLARYDQALVRPDEQATRVTHALLRGWGAAEGTLRPAEKAAQTLDLSAAVAAAASPSSASCPSSAPRDPVPESFPVTTKIRKRP